MELQKINCLNFLLKILIITFSSLSKNNNYFALYQDTHLNSCHTQRFFVRQFNSFSHNFHLLIPKKIFIIKTSLCFNTNTGHSLDTLNWKASICSFSRKHNTICSI